MPITISRMPDIIFQTFCLILEIELSLLPKNLPIHKNAI